MKKFGWTVIAVILLGGVLLYGAKNGWFEQAPHQAERLDQQDQEPETKSSEPPEGYVKVGGIYRPESDVRKLDVAEVPASDRPYLRQPGKTPFVDPNSNPHTKSVAEAIKNPVKLGHRLTAMIPAPKFDRARYEADPETYLNTIEPGRVWQSAKPGPGVTPLKRTSGYVHEVLQGETVVLEAAAEPGMPVTFVSPKLGQFDNLLSTTTVKANQEGVATANFKASTGTRGEVEVFAASPVHSGRARYLINVVVPGPG